MRAGRLLDKLVGLAGRCFRSGFGCELGMTYDQTASYWQRQRAIREAFGCFSNVDEVNVTFVEDYALAGARSRAGFVKLRVSEDWSETVLASGLTNIRHVFPVAVKLQQSGRVDVSLWRARYLLFGYITRQSAPGSSWAETGERHLKGFMGEHEEGFLARTSCGLGAAFHDTAPGAMIRAVRSRGRERARSSKAQEEPSAAATSA